MAMGQSGTKSSVLHESQGSWALDADPGTHMPPSPGAWAPLLPQSPFSILHFFLEAPLTITTPPLSVKILHRKSVSTLGCELLEDRNPACGVTTKPPVLSKMPGSYMLSE